MRNFANYQVDIRHRTSGVIKTICNQCLPTRHNKRDRSLRVNIDTGHCHCYHCGADFYVPDDTEEREKAERQAARKRRAAAVVPQHFSVLCSTPRKPPFPTPRNVGWSKRAVSRNPSSPNYASRNRRNLCRSSARRSVVSASTILKAGNW